LTIDHRCHRRSCVNPLHLRLLTRAANSRHNAWGRKRKCIRKHPLTGKNISVRVRRRTYVARGQERVRIARERRCRKCGYLRKRESMKRAAERRTEQQAQVAITICACTKCFCDVKTPHALCRSCRLNACLNRPRSPRRVYRRIKRLATRKARTTPSSDCSLGMTNAYFNA